MLLYERSYLLRIESSSTVTFWPKQDPLADDDYDVFAEELRDLKRALRAFRDCDPLLEPVARAAAEQKMAVIHARAVDAAHGGESIRPIVETRRIHGQTIKLLEIGCQLLGDCPETDSIKQLIDAIGQRVSEILRDYENLGRR